MNSLIVKKILFFLTTIIFVIHGALLPSYGMMNDTEEAPPLKRFFIGSDIEHTLAGCASQNLRNWIHQNIDVGRFEVPLNESQHMQDSDFFGLLNWVLAHDHTPLLIRAESMLRQAVLRIEHKVGAGCCSDKKAFDLLSRITSYEGESLGILKGLAAFYQVMMHSQKRVGSSLKDKEVFMLLNLVISNPEMPKEALCSSALYKGMLRAEKKIGDNLLTDREAFLLLRDSEGIYNTVMPDEMHYLAKYYRGVMCATKRVTTDDCSDVLGFSLLRDVSDRESRVPFFIVDSAKYYQVSLLMEKRVGHDSLSFVEALNLLDQIITKNMIPVAIMHQAKKHQEDLRLFLGLK